MIKKLFFYVLLAFVTLGCNRSKDVYTYFGGKIINPKSNYVILFFMDKAIDTLYLDKDDKFLGKYKKIDEGMYYFSHGLENQYIYLEPQDSLMLRLNTWDFDESLVFAGKGAERNNILIDCFLEDENENELFYELSKFKPKIFKYKIDSLLNLKEKTYQNYVLEHPDETEGFNKLLHIALTYPVYARVEMYPMVNIKYSDSTEFHKLDVHFYNHRAQISFNDNSLMYYPPYSQFVRNFLYNTTYALGHKPMTNEYSSNFTIDLLKTIHKNLNSEITKNAFLKQTVISHFYRKSSCNVNKDAFETYFKLSTNSEDKTQVKQLLADNEKLHKDDKITDFYVYDYTNKIHPIKDIIKNKNCLLLFWNPTYISPEYISSRINYLSNKYEDVVFIQIKIDENSVPEIQKLDIKNQYFIDVKSEAHQFLTSKMPRSIIINHKGIITNGFASISSNKIYEQLAALQQ